MEQLLNKVAGVYGLIAVFTGGSFAQLSMYIYSVGTLIALIWALRAVADVRFLYFLWTCSRMTSYPTETGRCPKDVILCTLILSWSRIVDHMGRVLRRRVVGIHATWRTSPSELCCARRAHEGWRGARNDSGGTNWGCSHDLEQRKGTGRSGYCRWMAMQGMFRN